MAGPTADFTAADAREFVREIHGVMRLGAPPDQADPPTFHWKQDSTYAVATPDGKPYNWTSAPTSTEPTKAPVQVPCAVEYLDASGQVLESTLGPFNPSKVRLTFVDNYDMVADFDWVTIGPSTFYWSERLPPQGLGTVEVVQVLAEAIDAGA